MGTNQVAGGHVRWNLACGHIKLSNCRRQWAMEPGMGGQTMLQAAMGDGTWNGDKSNCGRPCAMELDMGTHQIAGGHGRRNLEWGQIKLQAAMGDGTGNGDTSHCKRPSAMDPGIGANQIAGGHGRWNLEWGHLKMQAAMGNGTCNGDTSSSKRPWAMTPGIGINQIASGYRAGGFAMGTHNIAGDHWRWNLELGRVKLQAAMGDGTWNGDK